MLRCLTGVRYPLGASHSSLRSMAIRAQRAVSTIADADMRDRIAALLDMDGGKRMRYFEEMATEQERVLGEPRRGRKDFKSTTFIPTEPQHTMRLPLLTGSAAQSATMTPGYKTPAASRGVSPVASRAPSPSRAIRNPPLVLLNPTAQPAPRVLSFIKCEYCLFPICEENKEVT